MHFDLEIYFSGLCFFDIEYEDPKRRCIPVACTVLLVDATVKYEDRVAGDVHLGSHSPGVHSPRLVVPAKNLIIGDQDPPSRPISVSGLAEDLVTFDLHKACVSLSPSEYYPSSLYVPRQRQQGRFSRPDDSGARMDWYDWVALMKEVEPRLGDLKSLDCHKPEYPIISCVKFDRGALENLELGTHRGDSLVFDFRTACGEVSAVNDDCYSRCLSDRMVLRFRGLTKPLAVELAQWVKNGDEEVRRVEEFGIGASRPELETHSPIEASVTNLDKRYHVTQRAIYDFLWYYELFRWRDNDPKPVSERLIPWPQVHKYSGRTPSSGNCPPSGS